MVFEGKIGPSEIWQVGFGLIGGTPTSNAEANALAQLLWTEFTSLSDPPFWPSVRTTLWSAQTSLTGVRVYAYPAGGTTATYVGADLDETPIVGNVGTPLPNQVALVATLQTAESGRRRRGRVYLPMTGNALDAQGQVHSADASTIANNLAAAMSDWNAAEGNGKFSVISTTSGTSAPITSIKVDTRADVQRRRANKQLAESSAVALLTS